MWALLDEAYTDMRDRHEEAISMDKSLSLAVSLLPLISADSYLVKDRMMTYRLSSEGTNRCRQVMLSLTSEGSAWLVFSGADVGRSVHRTESLE